MKKQNQKSTIDRLIFLQEIHSIHSFNTLQVIEKLTALDDWHRKNTYIMGKIVRKQPQRLTKKHKQILCKNIFIDQNQNLKEHYERQIPQEIAKNLEENKKIPLNFLEIIVNRVEHLKKTRGQLIEHYDRCQEENVSFSYKERSNLDKMKTALCEQENRIKKIQNYPQHTFWSDRKMISLKKVKSQKKIVSMQKVTHHGDHNKSFQMQKQNQEMSHQFMMINSPIREETKKTVDSHRNKFIDGMGYQLDAHADVGADADNENDLLVDRMQEENKIFEYLDESPMQKNLRISRKQDKHQNCDDLIDFDWNYHHHLNQQNPQTQQRICQKQHLDEDILEMGFDL